MKFLSLIGVLILNLFLINQVSAYCHATFGNYYDCKIYSKKTSTGFSFTGYNDDAFYAEKIKDLKTFQMAMDAFKSIYNEVKSCTGDWCDCARYYFGMIPSNYTYFFNSSVYYPQMVSILNKLKDKYDLLSMDQISLQTKGYHFDEFYPDYPKLNEFCHNNEFSYEANFFYAETFQCEVLVWPHMSDCMASHLSLNPYPSSYSSFSAPQLEKYSTCLASYIKQCDIEIQNSIMLSHIYDYPQIINGNNLTTYIQGLISKSAPAPLVRSYVYTYYIQVLSLKKPESQLCNFDAKSYNVITTSSLKITAIPGDSGNVKVFSKVMAIFTYDKSTTSNYTAAIGTMFQSTFSNKAQVLNGPNNQKWLELVVYPFDIVTYDSNLQSAIITDFKTNTSVVIHNCGKDYGCNIEVYAPTQVFTGATGILIDGCSKTMSPSEKPQQTRDKTTIVQERRKRSLRNFQKNINFNF